MPEAPRTIKGDAAGEIAPPADGRWTEVIREAYADRVEAVLTRHIEGFKASILVRRAYSPPISKPSTSILSAATPTAAFAASTSSSSGVPSRAR